eukprot:TRINITY_DN2290_c0_g2_i1.p1 TRINITY_DN2290_c0_g2~~TRINITY_DN2290_c0_g2_i1.p1  ORF type:complete len:653 (+),score=118.88 TRINITY_DN2290_c0_g2_i1:87-1961(+)
MDDNEIPFDLNLDLPPPKKQKKQLKIFRIVKALSRQLIPPLFCLKKNQINGDSPLSEEEKKNIPEIVKAVFVQDMERLIKAWRNDPNCIFTLYDGRYPIHYACTTDNFEAIKKLLEWGVSPIELDKNHGGSPLHHAVNSRGTRCLEYLLSLDIDCNPKDQDEITPLILAIRSNDYKSVYHLIKAGVPIDGLYFNDIKQPLVTIAILARSTDALRILLENGADPNQLDDGFGQNCKSPPLTWACRIHFEPGIRLLLQYEADCDCVDHMGVTPLHVSVLKKYAMPSNLLLEAGADVTIKDKTGVSPIELAKLVGFRSFLRAVKSGTKLYQHNKNWTFSFSFLFPFLCFIYAYYLSGYGYFWSTILLTILALISIYFVGRVHFADPGVVKQAPIASSAVPFDQQYCATCQKPRPIRSKHCPLCGVCVNRFDHHCPWIANCVGEGNYHFFYWCVFWISITAIYIVLLAIITSCQRYHSFFGYLHILDLFTICMSSFGGGFAISMVLSHQKVAGQGFTTNEMANFMRYTQYHTNFDETGLIVAENPYSYGSNRIQRRIMFHKLEPSYNKYLSLDNYLKDKPRIENILFGVLYNDKSRLAKAEAMKHDKTFNLKNDDADYESDKELDVVF